ncbi:MAG: xanthine dehydrogenase family protein subunit M [Pseudomonadota bacterium]|nr:xanthine dehydrogenase family protein subunit M [Pseudomonadota bacterium]
MDYKSPNTIEEATALLAAANGNARILAGGTDLLVQIRGGFADPELIVDVKNIPELRAITSGSDGIQIGAAVSGAELGEHPLVSKVWPGVVEATELIGSTQIQGRASLGGNLCNASPAADTVPALVAAGATCRVAGAKGERTVPVEDITTGPGSTSLGNDEFVVDFNLPARPDHSGDAYLRFIPRTEMDIAVVGAGVSLTLEEDGSCKTAKVSLGAVAPTVVVLEDGAKALIGTKLDENALSKLDTAARAACNPIDDKRGTVKFRTDVAGVLAKRAALIAKERAEAN